MKKYSVNLWASHPDNDNDDCHTGTDFDNLEEAKACASNPWVVFNKIYCLSTEYIQLVGADIETLTKNPAFQKKADDRSDELREQAMLAGMAGGCNAYNEVMGWD